MVAAAQSQRLSGTKRRSSSNIHIGKRRRVSYPIPFILLTHGEITEPIISHEFQIPPNLEIIRYTRLGRILYFTDVKHIIEYLRENNFSDYNVPNYYLVDRYSNDYFRSNLELRYYNLSSSTLTLYDFKLGLGDATVGNRIMRTGLYRINNGNMERILDLSNNNQRNSLWLSEALRESSRFLEERYGRQNEYSIIQLSCLKYVNNVNRSDIQREEERRVSPIPRRDIGDLFNRYPILFSPIYPKDFDYLRRYLQKTLVSNGRFEQILRDGKKRACERLFNALQIAEQNNLTYNIVNWSKLECIHHVLSNCLTGPLSIPIPSYYSTLHISNNMNTCMELDINDINWLRQYILFCICYCHYSSSTNVDYTKEIVRQLEYLYKGFLNKQATGNGMLISNLPPRYVGNPSNPSESFNQAVEEVVRLNNHPELHRLIFPKFMEAILDRPNTANVSVQDYLQSSLQRHPHLEYSYKYLRFFIAWSFSIDDSAICRGRWNGNESESESDVEMDGL